MMRTSFITAAAIALLAPAARSSFVAPPLKGRAASAARGARGSTVLMAGNCVVTDGTDSFYSSRTLFQMLHDHAEYERITAFSSSIADAKKMCISRQARYSGLIDALDFAEGGDAELAAALKGASAWVAVNADVASLPAQLAAAQEAGVARAFVHVSADADSLPDTEALATAAGSIDYTLMVTGKLGKAGGAGGSAGLLMAEAGEATCGEVPIDDAFRLLVESLSIPEV